LSLSFGDNQVPLFDGAGERNDDFLEAPEIVVMRRATLFCAGMFLGLAAVAILWHGPGLYAFADGWLSAVFTRLVGLAIIIEGAFVALGAALCLGRALVPLGLGSSDAAAVRPALGGGGPVLPTCGLLFLIAAVGPIGEGSRGAEQLEVMNSMPGQWGADLVADVRRDLWATRVFGVLWLAVGAALLGSPLLLEQRLWHLGWRVSGIGCGIAAAGLLLSGLGVLTCYSNALAMEGANKDTAFVGYLAVLAGALLAAAGSTVAVLTNATSARPA
jgi:hypothetical protein